MEALINMKKTLLALSLLTLSAGGCAAIDGNFVGKSEPTASNTSASNKVGYEPMGSLPPAPLKEDVPRLDTKEVWIPGYYQPVAGNWMWHQGQVQGLKSGYVLMPAAYREEGGRVYFTPPRWRRSNLAQSGDKK